MTADTPTPECAPPDREMLLPCPFCGQAPVASGSGERSRGLMIECVSDDCPRPHVSYYNHATAREFWNRRYLAPAHPPQKPVDAEIVEAVERHARSLPHWNSDYPMLRRAAALLRGEPDPAGGAK